MAIICASGTYAVTATAANAQYVGAGETSFAKCRACHQVANSPVDPRARFTQCLEAARSDSRLRYSIFCSRT